MTQIVLNGLISGLSIALLAVAFQVVYLPTRVFFIGLAGLYILAPYICFAFLKAGFQGVLGVVASLVAVTLLALSFEWFNHAPLARKGASDGVQLISSLGLYILLAQVVTMIWGNAPKALRAETDSTFNFGGAVLTNSQFLIAGIAGLLLIGFLATLRYSDLGLRLRAMADNPVQFALYGYSVDRHRLVAFGLAGLFTTSAALLTANDIGFEPNTGLHAVLLAIVAVIIGGRTSFQGPIVGGLLLGAVRAQVIWNLSARWQEAVTFLVLGLFLLLRPQGIFGQRTRVEETA